VSVFGGAAGGGKSWSLLLEPLKHFKVPGWSGVIFRRTHPEIMASGGLWDQSQRIYPHVGAVPKVGESSWTFPSGAKIRFAHLQHPKDVFSWMGSELAFIGFDELTLFDESQFWYLFSRNRTMCGRRPYIRATCNPDADSWVAKLLSWWIDPDSGLAVNERAGALRWFVRVNDQLEWADSAEALGTKCPELVPKSLSFVPAKLSDNAALMAVDPGYLANLLALPLVERERLLGGNWKIRPAAGLVFNRGWFEVVQASPREAVRVRYWDKASTPGGGDWSAGVKLARDAAGLFYVEDVIRGQWSYRERNAVIKQTAALDGPEVSVWVEQEPGSGGQESAEISIRELAGYAIHAERVTGDKLTRAQGFSAQAEARNLKLVYNPVRDWIPAYLDELHAFPMGKWDDQVDASSGAFNKLTLSAVEPWQALDDEDNRSMIGSAPPGVFLDGHPR
jgi:predicted phage terminase large subunit-like protein